MKERSSGTVAALLAALAIGCHSGSVEATGQVDASADVGVSGEAGVDASDAATLDVCGAFFDAFVACEPPFQTVPTLNPLLPASEVARIRGRYETVCAATMALPGIEFTASAVAACTAAIQSEGCYLGAADPACSFSGTSVVGASCVGAAVTDQCGDGCVLRTQTDAGASTLRPPCEVAPFSNGCGGGAECDLASPENKGGPGTCIALTFVGAGQGCAVFGQVCDTGMYCWGPGAVTDPTCTPAGHAGDACPLQPGGFALPVDGSCAAPLFCSVPGDAGAGTCQPPGGPGVSCAKDDECAAGLGCVPGSTSAACGALTFVGAGQTCGGSVRCLQGSCSGGGLTGTCSAVIPDGQPCQTNGGAPCDVYATCVKGTCMLGYPTCP